MPDEIDLRIRPVRPGDKPRVLDFTAGTWGDGDYIQDVFDEWLADPAGQFTAVELEGQAVAIARLTDLGDGELWLEGMRVDPKHRKKGISKTLHAYHVSLARKLGGDVLRYATGDDNAVSRILGERTGFRHVGNYWWHEAIPSDEYEPPVRLAREDWPVLRTRFRSPLVRVARRLYQRDWRWRGLSEVRLKAHLASGEVLGLRRADGTGLRAWSICALDEDTQMGLQHLDAIDSASLAEMAGSMRRYARDAGRSLVTTFAPEPSPLIGALREAGYRTEEMAMIVLELKLRK